MFRALPILLPLLAFAQDPPVLTYSGEPIRVPFACAQDELQAAGLLCTDEEPCAIYLELNGIATAGKKMFVGGDLHSTSGTLDSILLATDDGGSTWKEPTRRISGAAIEQLQMYDLEHGWAAGETQFPLPSDPFFLITSDGGQMWRRQQVTDDGGPGAIQHFWFDSADHGQLIVDAGRTSTGGRYVAYETHTGGSSWSMKSSTAKPPVIKGAPAADDGDFRVRAEPGGKSYLVEKRIGGKWETAAAFLIEAASCRHAGGN